MVSLLRFTLVIGLVVFAEEGSANDTASLLYKAPFAVPQTPTPSPTQPPKSESSENLSSDDHDNDEDEDKELEENPPSKDLDDGKITTVRDAFKNYVSPIWWQIICPKD